MNYTLGYDGRGNRSISFRPTCQAPAKINRYTGMRSVIFSGSPHLDECDIFARYVLPNLKQCKLSHVHGRRVQDPIAPLTTAPRTESIPIEPAI